MRKSKARKLKKIAEIEILAKSGHSLDEIVELSGLNRNHLSVLYHNCKNETNATYKELKCKAQSNLVKKKLWNEGGLTFSELRDENDFSLNALGEIGEGEIEIDGEKIQIKEFLYDDFVLRGEKLVKIGEVIGLSRQGAEQYLNLTGQHQKWGKCREQKELEMEEKKKRLNERKKRVLDLLVKKILSDSEDNWALNMAVRVHPSKENRGRKISLEKLYGLYQAYRTCKENGIDITLSKLAEQTSLDMRAISGYLKNANLESLRMLNLKKTSEKEKERVASSLKTNFSIKTLEYFIKIRWYVIRDIREKSKFKRKTQHEESLRKHQIRFFNHKTASEIYEAIDDGIPPEDITEVLELDKISFGKYLEKRKAIDEEIVKGLRTIYPEIADKINQPYLTRESKELQSQERQENYSTKH
jgi:hypothetical protein